MMIVMHLGYQEETRRDLYSECSSIMQCMQIVNLQTIYLDLATTSIQYFQHANAT